MSDPLDLDARALAAIRALADATRDNPLEYGPPLANRASALADRYQALVAELEATRARVHELEATIRAIEDRDM